MRGDDAEIIRQGLLDRCEDLCRILLPNGKREGGGARWMAHDPVAQDFDKTPALSVPLTGNNRGRWKCFRGTAGPAKHDLLGLIAYVNRTDNAGAFAFARDFLGLKAMSQGDMRQMQVKANAAAKKRAEDGERQRLEKIKQAAILFRKNTHPLYAGAQGSDFYYWYFRRRAIDLNDIERLNPQSMRYSRSTEYWKGAVWENRRKTKDGPLFPAIHSALRGPTGVVTACHVTFLDPVDPVKAPVTVPKLVRGDATGSVIELSMGRENVPFWEAAKSSGVIVCEGIETGLSLAIAVPEARVWAGGSITNMGNVPVHLDCVRQIIVARDNNFGNKQAENQLEQSIAKMEMAGKPIAVMASHVGDDFNDLMQGDA